MFQKIVRKLLVLVFLVGVPAALFIASLSAVQGASVEGGNFPAWAPFTTYLIGAQVSFDGLDYQAVQSHTSQPSFQPPNVPALWMRLPMSPTPTFMPDDLGFGLAQHPLPLKRKAGQSSQWQRLRR